MDYDLTNLIQYKEISEAIREACKDSVYETCGIIISNNGVAEICKCTNIATDPLNFFLIDRKEINNFSAKGKIIAYYHVHLFGSELSTEDIAVMTKLNLPCIIYDSTHDSLHQENPDKDFIPPFEGRPFIAGHLDCSALVKDYYFNILNIKLPVLVHPVKSMSWTEIQENWSDLQIYNKEDYNFQEITKNELRKNDLILCRAKEIKAPVHCLIYLSNSKILHHPSERKSVIENYTDFYIKLSVNFLRYRD